MKVSLRWLRDWVDLPHDISPETIAKHLTLSGTEVEGITVLGENLKGVVIGRVLEVAKHPNADRLRLCTVDAGTGANLRIVCGAANVRTGLTVALATIGAKLPNGITIAKSKIRGEVSEGMICSAEELALAESSEGILELDEKLSIGQPFAAAMGYDDVVFELGLTPNRPDLLSHRGVARELAAILGCSLRQPQSMESGTAKPGNGGISVLREDPKACPGYIGVAIDGISPVCSPMAVQRRLEACGIRPINQVVDATNYVMLDLGQPLHAFDHAAIAGGTLVVRRAKVGESLELLNGSTVTLTQDDLVIADSTRAHALAGVMGGQSSAIHDGTTRMILECASFEPTTVRRTSRRLSVLSDSSHRFERIVDRSAMALAVSRALSLIVEWTKAAGKPAPTVFSSVESVEPTSPQSSIEVDPAFVNKRLGITLEEGRLQKLLTAIGCGVTSKGSSVSIAIPSWRPDLLRPIDIVEEVARLFGYDNIPAKLPTLPMHLQTVPSSLSLSSRVMDSLRSQGFCQSIHTAFCGSKDLLSLGWSEERLQKHAVRLKNPIAQNEELLRPSLLVSLLNAVAWNRNHGTPDVRLAEVSKVFSWGSKEAVVERLHVAGVMTGARYPLSWALSQVPTDFFDLKGAVERLLADLGTSDGNRAWSLRPKGADVSDPSIGAFHPHNVLGVYFGESCVGLAGTLHPQTLQKFSIESEVYGFTIDLQEALAVSEKRRDFKGLVSTPVVRRDLAIVLGEEIPAKTVLDLIFSLNNEMIDRFEVFDLYRGKPIPEGKKSMAIAIHYQAKDRTLTGEEVEAIHGRVVERLGRELGAEIRA